LLVQRIRKALLQPGADADRALQAFSLEGRATFTPIEDSAFTLARNILHRVETAPSNSSENP